MVKFRARVSRILGDSGLMKVYRWILRWERGETLIPIKHKLGGAVAVQSGNVTALVEHKIRVCPRRDALLQDVLNRFDTGFSKTIAFRVVRGRKLMSKAVLLAKVHKISTKLRATVTTDR